MCPQSEDYSDDNKALQSIGLQYSIQLIACRKARPSKKNKHKQPI